MYAMAIFSAVVSLLTSPTFAPMAAPAPSQPPTEKVVIDVVTVNGSGCPAGTVAVAASPDNTVFTITYSRFIAVVGVGAGSADYLKNCQINLRVKAPSGFTYAIAQTVHRGFASLKNGATAVQRANHYFQGQSPTPYTSHSYNGPFQDNWQSTDAFDLAARVYAPCGEQRPLNINTELRVNAGASDPQTTTSFISMDPTDSAITSTYRFSWLECRR